jgi:hypothetical protein
MKKYTYKVTGEYKDWLEMKKENTVFHDGSLIGLISYVYDRLELRLNYGTDKYYDSEIKKAGDVIIIVPLEECLNKQYMYIPLVLTIEEYKEIIEISYIDKELLKNIREATMNDIKNILLCNFKSKFKMDMNIMSFDELLDNVIAFSEYDEEVKGALEQIDEYGIITSVLQEKELTNIAMYVDIENNVYELDVILYDGNEFYIRITDNYVVQI